MNALQANNSISPQDLHQLMSDGVALHLLDVRTPVEFGYIHVAGAESMPLDQLHPEALQQRMKANGRPIYIICQSGARALRAREKLERYGIRGCILVEGGTQAWMDAGLPVVRGEKKVLPLMRQVQIVVGFVSGTGALLALLTSPLFAIVPLLTGSGLIFAGISGTCGMALLLAKMPWNRAASCASTSNTKTL
jgi:rhodanese-related sulfurtransferase